MNQDGPKNASFLNLIKDHRLNLNEIFGNLPSVISLFRLNIQYRYLSEMS